jgi:hypothetical protein
MADPGTRLHAILVRLVTVVAGSPEPERHGPVIRWLLTQVGRDPDRFHRLAECRQCGGWRSVTVVRLGRRRARYWCQGCGAVVSLGERSALRPVGELLATESTPKPVPPAPDPRHPGTSDTDPRQVMPEVMLRWVRGRFRKRIDLDQLDKSTIHQLYRAWDSHLERLPADQLAELAVAGEPPPVPGLPAFSTVVGALHDACYRSDLVVDRLASEGPVRSAATPPEVVEAALWTRTEHARRWLSARGGELCWIYRRVPSGGPVTPARDEVEAAIDALRSGRRASPAQVRAIRAALFGTDGGPPIAVLLAAHPAEEMVAALERYLASRGRPLRDQALARLNAPLAGPAAVRSGRPR